MLSADLSSVTSARSLLPRAAASLWRVVALPRSDSALRRARSALASLSWLLASRCLAVSRETPNVPASACASEALAFWICALLYACSRRSFSRLYAAIRAFSACSSCFPCELRGMGGVRRIAQSCGIIAP